MSRRDAGAGWLTMAAAALGRTALGAVLAWAAHTALSPSGTQAFLQILFLQGGLAVLFSASAYARAAQLSSHDRSDVAADARAFGQFIAWTTSVALLLGWLVVPRYELDGPTHLAVVSLMVVGAAFTAVNSFVQGFLVGGHGQRLTAFWPTLATSILFAAVTAVTAAAGVRGGIVLLTLLWVTPQVASPVLVAASSRLVRDLVVASRAATASRGNYFALAGAANAASIGVAFAFRERWTSSNTESVGATTFTVVRLTELVYQIAVMLLSSLPRLVRLASSVSLATTPGRWLTAALALVTSGLCLAPALLWSDWSLDRLLVAELLAAPARLLAMVTALMLLARTTTRAYVVGIGSTMVAALCIMYVPLVQTSPYGLQAYQAVGTLPIVVVALLVTHKAWSGRDVAAAPSEAGSTVRD